MQQAAPPHPPPHTHCPGLAACPAFSLPGLLVTPHHRHHRRRPQALMDQALGTNGPPEPGQPLLNFNSGADNIQIFLE